MKHEFNGGVEMKGGWTVAENNGNVGIKTERFTRSLDQTCSHLVSLNYVHSLKQKAYKYFFTDFGKSLSTLLEKDRVAKCKKMGKTLQIINVLLSNWSLSSMPEAEIVFTPTRLPARQTTQEGGPPNERFA